MNWDPKDDFDNMSINDITKIVITNTFLTNYLN